MKRALVACLVVAACGDNQQPVEIAVPLGTPAFVAYKANGAWHGAKPTERGYLIESVGAYQFVFVCGNSQGFDVEELFADTSDGDQAVFTNLGSSDMCGTIRAPTVDGHITGTMVQPGFVFIDDEGESGATTSWTYDLGITIGRRDLVAVPQTGEIAAIRRDIDVVVGPNPQAPIDLAGEATTLVRVPTAITGLDPGSSVLVSSTLRTVNNTDLTFSLFSDAALVLPETALRPGERQFFDLDVQQGATNGVYMEHVALDAGAELVAHLQPPPATSYATSELGTSVTWQHEALDAVAYELLVTANGSRSVIHGVATRTVANHTLDLSVDRDAPGFLDEWRPVWSNDLDSSTRTFQIAAMRDGACYETELFDRGRQTATVGLGSRCGVLRR